MKTIKLLFSVLILGLLSLAPTNNAAATPTLAPAQQIKQIVNEVQDLVKANQTKLADPSFDKQLKGLLKPMFDFDEMSRRCLGSYWKQATTAEQSQFVDLFGELLARTYLNRIKRNASASEIASIKDQIDGEKAMVRSVMAVGGEQIAIDYRMISKGDKWQVYDLVVENVGLVTNYRNEFPEIIKKEGFPGLLKKLQEKQAGQRQVSAESNK